MDVFVNDLSLHGQFESVTTFRAALGEILHCQQTCHTFDRNYYVPRTIVNRQITNALSFKQAVMATKDRELTRRVISWIDKHGPFADDVLTRDQDNYYTYGTNEDIVTEEILGEAAARVFAQHPVALVSFSPSDFTHSPLVVTWCRSDEDSESCEIDNVWDNAKLEPFLKGHEAEVQSWDEMIRRARARYSHLILLDTIGSYLEGQPFSISLASRILELLGFLNDIKAGYLPSGERTEQCETLLENHFRRKNAIFTDASETEKNDEIFRAAMTFRGPDGSSLECFWHGKIRHRQFRIHFSDIGPDKPLYIAYIGPKRTKK